MDKTLYCHVHDKFRHIVSLPDNERLRFMDEPRWIGYDVANQMLDILQGLLNKPKQPRMPNLLLVGESNNGKTTVIKQFYKKFGEGYVNEFQEPVLPVISIQSPPTANEKELYMSLIEAFALPYRSSDSCGALRYQVIHAFRACHVKLLIIDEIHSLLTGTARQQRQIMNAIKFLCNELEIPIVAVGTKDAVRVLHTDPQHASRFDVATLPVWENDINFQKLLGSFEKVLPLKKPSYLSSSEVARQIHTISEGRVGNVRRLLLESATYAISSGTEQITGDVIRSKSWLRPTKGIRKIIG